MKKRFLLVFLVAVTVLLFKPIASYAEQGNDGDLGLTLTDQDRREIEELIPEGYELVEPETNFTRAVDRGLKIYGNAHIQGRGWAWSPSDLSKGIGTVGVGKRLEAVRINVQGSKGSYPISYRLHVQTYGWLNWSSNGATNGTVGQAKRAEAIQIKMGNSNISVVYRTHIQSIGWTRWVKDGQVSGTTGRGLRLEAIEAYLVQKK